MTDTTSKRETLKEIKGISKWVPGIAAIRNYKSAWLRQDIVAAIILAALLIPQGMAYAELAGLPAITGLYTTVICMLAYAMFGPSPYLVLGPDSSLGPIIAAIILPLAMGNTDTAIALAGMLAVIVGLISIGAGLAKFGFIADLLSKPVRLGYMAGLSVTIVVGQLPKMFGFSIEGGNLFLDMRDFFQNISQTNIWALSIGFLSLIIILGLKKWAPRIPGILVAVVVTILLSSFLDLGAKDVSIVGVLPQGFPMPSFPKVELTQLPLLIGGAFGIVLVTIGDTISVSAAFAAKRGTEVDSNQEIFGIGAANFFSGLFQGFPVSTSSSRTAVADQAGAKSQLTGIASAVLVLLMLLFLPWLVQNLTMSVLASVIIVSAIGLIEIPALRRLYAARKSEFGIAVACFLGVAFIGVLEGIVIAVLLSILQMFIRAWNPKHFVLGRPKEIEGFHDVIRHPDAEQIPGMVMIRWDAPLFFANANIFRDFVRDLIIKTEPTPYWVVIAAEPITDVDTTAADMLVELDNELNADGIHLVFAELQDVVKDKIKRYGLYDTIDRRHFYHTLDEAVEEFEKSYQQMLENEAKKE